MSELVAAIEKRGSDMAGIAKGLRTNDADGTVASVAALVANLATGIPIVGKLAGEAARWAFAKTAYARLQKAAVEINAELDEEERERKLAAILAEMVARALTQGGERAEKVDAIAGPLNADFDDFQFNPSEHVRVHIEHVKDGALGVDVGDPKGRLLVVTQAEVSGRGTTGVKL